MKVKIESRDERSITHPNDHGVEEGGGAHYILLYVVLSKRSAE